MSFVDMAVLLESVLGLFLAHNLKNVVAPQVVASQLDVPVGTVHLLLQLHHADPVTSAFWEHEEVRSVHRAIPHEKEYVA